MIPKGEATKGMRSRDIFLSALELAPSARAAFLDKACQGDARSRAQVDELLREQEGLGDFLEKPALEDPRLAGTLSLPVAAVSEKPGDRIDRYKLLQKIGEGGCGVVYMAEQEQPVRRRVALKIIKLGMDTRAVIARFEAERQALAMMDHPNIARVLEAGATETGRPYFVMELVRGVRITEYCDKNNVTTRERVRLFIQVCNAIQHAHQKGIIHRDIKPSNILVTLHDGVPVPKVIDFGIAKATDQRLTDKTLFTEFHSFIGTPAYMSPEQAQMSGLDIDTRSDIYSLGVLLYELLAGVPPFDPAELTRGGLDECRRTIREQDPKRPSTRLTDLSAPELTRTAEARQTEAARLIHSLRGDLDWIVMKCLEKDRARRYVTASDLAEDTQRYLDGDAVLARPPTNTYRLRKFLRRHRGVMSAAAAIAGALLTGIGVSTWQAVRATTAERQALKAQDEEVRLRANAEEQRRRAEQESASARLSEYVADINLVQQSLAPSSANYGRALQLLHKHRPLSGAHMGGPAREDARPPEDLRGFEWRYLWQLTRGDEHTPFPAQESAVNSVSISSAGDLLAVGLNDRFNIWSTSNRTLVFSYKRSQQQRFGPGGGGIWVCFLPGDRGLVSASGGSLRLWSLSDWQEKKSLSGNPGPIALSKDGALLAAQTFEGVRILDTATWEEVAAFKDATAPLSFSPDNRRLAADSRTNGGVMIWSLSTATPPLLLADSTNLFVRGRPGSRGDGALTFSPDGKYIVAPRNMPSERGVFVLTMWDAATGRELSSMPGDPEHVEHTGKITAVVFSSDGRTLASASMDHTIRLWDFPKRQRIGALQGHLNEVWAVAFASDGRTIASGAKGGGLKLWTVHSAGTISAKRASRPAAEEETLGGARLPLGFSRDGRQLAALSRSGDVLFFDAASGEKKQEIKVDYSREPEGRRPARFRPTAMPSMVSLSADFGILAASVGEGKIQLWNRETGDSLKVTNAGGGFMSSVTLSPDGTALVTGGWDRGLRWWNVHERTNTVIESSGNRPVFSPDGRTLAVFGRDRVEIWDVAKLSMRTNFAVEGGLAFGGGPAGSFSPNSQLLAVLCQDDIVRLYDTASTSMLGTLLGHKQSVQTVAFSPDGKTIATGSDDSTVKFWNVANQQELLTVRRLGGTPRGLVFSPDGQALAVGASSTQPGYVRLLRAPALNEIDAMEARATQVEPTTGRN